MTDTLVEVQNVSKKFCRSLKRSLWYGIRDLGGELVGHRCATPRLRVGEFWAVSDVSFVLRRGDCVGLIGHNGAGKTTLLRMLNGLVRPDSGRIAIRGRVGALIALGAGFNPVLSGRENIYVNGAVLGLTRKETDARFDEIVAFAGIEEFIDAPVRSYSSGMYVRLGFSIAVHVRPDVLLVDEALAVGDISFIFRCLNRIAELRRGGTGVIFVSHNELQVREAADRCLVMADGKLIWDGGLDEAYLRYQQALDRDSAESTVTAPDLVHAGSVRMISCGVEASPAPAGDPLYLTVRCEALKPVRDASLELRFWNAHEQVVTSVSSCGQGFPLDLQPGRNVIRVEIAAPALMPGRYRLAGGFRQDGEVLGWSPKLAQVEIKLHDAARFGEGVFLTKARFTAERDVPGGGLS